MLRKNKGFTLIELMVVIVIIGVLAALAIPKFTMASDRAKWSEVPSVIAAYENAQLAYVTETVLLGLLAEIVFDVPTGSRWFAYPGDALGTAELAAGTYSGAVKAGVSPIGNIDPGEGVQTSVTAAQAINRAIIAGTTKAEVVKMIPSYFP
jgi:prepilin-type N-terminal cleavage/methylation domain-containing protein